MNTQKPPLALRLVAAVALALAACGGSSGGGGGGPKTGALTVAVTDAASLELTSLELEVTGILLERANGGFVPALGGPIAVDLVSLEGVSRVLSLVALPKGFYTKVHVRFALTNARAHILGSSSPATILDWDGNALPPELTLPIALVGALEISANRHRLLELDFDLDQSVRVDQPNNTVFLEPALVLRIDPTPAKELLVMGRLEKVKGNAVTVGLEDEAGLPLQSVKVKVDQDSVYQIDGVPLTGGPGRMALAALPVGTAVQVFGAVKPKDPSIAGPYIEAGTGTFEGGLGIVEGHVIGRTSSASPLLTVYGNTHDASHTNFASDMIITVHTDALATAVVAHGTAQPFSLDDLNVGQRVWAYGALNGAVLDATLPKSVVRTSPARVFGLALGPPGADLVLDLEKVGLLAEASFQWIEGGATPLDPSALVASVGTLGMGLAIGAGTPVDLRGSFSAVGEASFDFSATALTDLSHAAPLLLLQNRNAGLGVAATVSAGQLELAFTGTLGPNEFALIDRGYLETTAWPLSPPFTASGGTGNFLIRDRVTQENVSLTDFADFAAVLNLALGSGAEIYFFGARGAYDEAANTMQVDLATVMVD